MFKKILFLFIPFILITVEGATILDSTVLLENNTTSTWHKKVFEKAWLFKSNYMKIKNDLNRIKTNSKEIEQEKCAIALMLFLEDKKFEKFFEEYKPKKLNEFSNVVEVMLEHYTPKNEGVYFQILSIVQTYPYDNVLDGFFSHYDTSFSFKKFVRKNYYNMALVVLKYENEIDSENISEFIALANSIYDDSDTRKKVLKLILKKVDIYRYRSYGDDKYSLDIVDKIVFSLRNEDNLDDYLRILESKLKKFDYDYKYWEYKEDDKRIFNGFVKFLGKKHFFIKAMPTFLKEFYNDNIGTKIKIIPIDKQQLINTHWTENSCHVQTYFDNNGDIHFMYFKETYHFGVDNKIYIAEHNYKDSQCKLKNKDEAHEYYREYKEIKTVNKSNDLYEIRLEEFRSFAKSFSDIRYKDAFFDLSNNKLCFSKSIFTREKEKNESDKNGNTFTSHVSGFYIDESESDEVDYSNCLIKLKT